MEKELEHHSDEGLDFAVYLCLLGLTAATLAASLLNHGGRIMVVSVALVIATMKASFIGFYYMGLRRERALPWIILGVGAVAVAILFVGLLPDMTFSRF
jgi:caa(3)-type oxidase subunit IV